MIKVYPRVIHDLYAILRQFPSSSSSHSYLSAHKFFIRKPFFQSFEKDVLPPNAAFQKIVGPKTCSSNLAKQLVALDACKKLHQVEAATKFAASDESLTGAGTIQRKELHGMERVRALHGTWALESNGATLNAYRIHFVCDQENENFSDFVLLFNSSVDADIASAKIKLFLIPNKIVTSCISPYGKIYLSAEQVEKSKLFQEIFFNGMFGRLFTGSKASGLKREILFGRHRMPWSSTKMYLLLPLEPSSDVRDTGWSIEWKVIYESISVMECLEKIRSVDDESGNATTTSPDNSQIIKLANKSLHVRYLKDSVVFSIQDGRIYSVLDVMNDPFDQIHATQCVSFTDYYSQKYGIVLRYPQQPLLLLKQSHNPEVNYRGEKIVEEEQVHAPIPPELLVHINVSTDIMKSFYLLPSIMHQLESLMLACQLRDEIAFDQIPIPISLILEAITTERCCESCSLRRLKLLGNSVLKYALSCYLFLKYPTEREGYLTDCRSQAVRHSALHKLGTSRSLQGYIRDNAFDPLCWLAPGQISIHPLKCVCGVDTYNVPIERKYTTEEASVVVGVPCDKGHRWMNSKTIADCVEALVGAYYAGGGLPAALSLIRWLGIDITIDKVLVEKAKISAPHSIHNLKVGSIESLESKLSYVFSVKGLLLEAITHPSYHGYCYQRLEFLGDSVLDLVIIRYHFLKHKDVGPGVLTGLRSALVSNKNFAQIAARNNFHKYLQHGSGKLSEKIKEYVTSIANNQCGEDMLLPNGLLKAPKCLGDIVESIAGAILIDTDLDLNAVWEIFKPLLSPIRTQLTVQFKDDLLLSSERDKNTRIAKSQAGSCLLKQPKAKGIPRDRCTPKRNKGPSISTANSPQLTAQLRSSGYCSPLKENSYPKANCKATKAKLDRCTPKMNKGPSISTANSHQLTANWRSSGYRPPLKENSYPKTNCKSTKAKPDRGTPKRNKGSSNSTANSHQLTANWRSSVYPSPLKDNSYPKTNCKSTKAKLDSPDLPITVPIRMEKGGPRIALFNLCKILRCPMPHFELKEENFRTPIILNGVQTPNFNLFRAIVFLHIPNSKVITVQGEERTDKKTSQDSAAREVLLELEKQEICILKDS